jgi:nitrate/TMAO reductase-like tetraheme cytochrome c subunit
MRLRTLLIAAGLLSCLFSIGLAISPAFAEPLPVNGEKTANPHVFPSRAADNSLCLSCHTKEGFSVELESGETLPLTINQEVFEGSVHGTNEVTCVSCHVETPSFPHPERTVETLREVTVNYSAVCAQCHADQSAKAMDSVHQKAFSEGNQNAAVCADCHDPHAQQPMTDPASGKLSGESRLQVVNTCARCHSAIYNTYEKSVHGAALTQEGNLDVPTCIDCHGVHNIQDPTTATFRNSTPYLCATCHTDEALMGKYGLSTQVLNTYVADFHGTTVVLFDKTFPDQPTNKPVCTDCHGVHDIAKSDDPEKGLAVRENLLVRCQACHPAADANFPDAWLSHYIPTADKYPIVYYVNLFYKFMIPGVLIPMAILVVMDFSRKMINRFAKPKPAAVSEAPLPIAEEEKPVAADAPQAVEEPKAEAGQTPEEANQLEAAQSEEPQPEESQSSPAAAEEEAIDEEQHPAAPEESQNDSEEASHD